jgi:hypothetical protein
MERPICRHLRTKKIYIPAESEDPFSETAEASIAPHCWCNLTMTEVGRDDRPVSAGTCVPGRICHRD